jgi:hypothetical protein
MVRLGQEIIQADIERGAEQERERIIKLLEKSALNAYHSDPVTMNDGILACIALIKGEQK